jgi:hypothetical protein
MWQTNFGSDIQKSLDQLKFLIPNQVASNGYQKIGGADDLKKKFDRLNEQLLHNVFNHKCNERWQKWAKGQKLRNHPALFRGILPIQPALENDLYEV